MFELKEPLCSEDQATMTESEDPKPVDLVVDTLIGYLEQQTNFLRATANHVFSLITSEVEDTTLDLILKVSLCIHSPVLYSCLYHGSNSNLET